MTTLPAKLLTGTLSIFYATDYQPDATNPAAGYPYKWLATIETNGQPLGFPGDDFSYGYNASDILVDDWVTSIDDGRALRISSINSVNGNVATVILEDVESYNAMIDSTLSLDGSIPSGSCIVFSLNESGLPVLGPIPVGLFTDVIQDNLFARFNQFNDYEFAGSGNGDSGTLGTPTDGSFIEGAIPGWVPGTTTTADAFDNINRFLAYALPDKPTNLQDYAITFTNSSSVEDGTLLASGIIPTFIPDVSLPYLTDITVIDDVTAISNTLTNIGYGDMGTLSLTLNNVLNSTRDLTSADDSGTYNNLTILSDFTYPDTSGVWKAMNLSFSLPVQSGINEVVLSHTFSGSTTKRFIVESLTSDPVISNPSYSANVENIIYSSGVPHYTSGTTFNYSMTCDNVVGRTFTKYKMMGFTTSPSFGGGFMDYNSSAIPSVLNVNHGSITISNQIATFDTENTAGSSFLQFTARNSLFSNTVYAAKKINYLHGTNATSFLNDNYDTMRRISLDNGTKPLVSTIAWDDTTWNSGNSSSLGSLREWDAPIVAGSATANKNDYSVDYLPVGPDFSSKPDTQYLTFKVQRISNYLEMVINGTYTGLYILLPGITNSMPNATNGWWDATKQADYAPLAWPGHASASDGCLKSDDQDGHITLGFGNISSASSLDNMILIRFELTGDDIINSISVL
jgi:hypothetical protein